MARQSYGERWAEVSLRAKITGVTVFILFLGLIVAGVGTLSVLRPMLINNQTTALAQLYSDPTLALAPGASTNALNRDDIIYADQKYYVALLDSEGNLQVDNTRGHSSASLPVVPNLTGDQLAQAQNQITTLRNAEGVEWRAIVIPITITDKPPGTLLIAASTANINEVVAQYVIIFTGFGIAVILLGAALTRLLVTATFLPLAEVEKTALEIARGDYSKRIMVANPHTEVGHLGESLNVMLDRLDGSLEDRERTIERMRRFIGDASHELRTPLVSVRGYAELYRMGALQDDEQVRQAMERIEKEAIRTRGSAPSTSSRRSPTPGIRRRSRVRASRRDPYRASTAQRAPTTPAPSRRSSRPSWTGCSAPRAPNRARAISHASWSSRSGSAAPCASLRRRAGRSTSSRCFPFRSAEGACARPMPRPGWSARSP